MSTNIQSELPALSPAQRLVAGALTEIPDATVKALAAASGTSKSTVAKTLLKLELAGAARRTLYEAGDTRFADTWSPTVLTGAILVAAAAEEPGYGHAVALLSAPVDGPTAATSEEPDLDLVLETNGARASDITHVPDAGDTMSPTVSEDDDRTLAQQRATLSKAKTPKLLHERLRRRAAAATPLLWMVQTMRATCQTSRARPPKRFRHRPDRRRRSRRHRLADVWLLVRWERWLPLTL